MPRSSSRALRLRRVAIFLHRWVGLVIAAFLIVAGLTGSVMAFYRDLDRALNPELLRARPPSAGAQVLDAIDLRDRVQAQLPKDHEPLGGVLLNVRPDETVNYWIDGRETFVDPYTGHIVGSREFGAIREGKRNLLTFLYLLHSSLALGDVGTWILGLVALLWTIDCFVGAYLTFPSGKIRDEESTRRGWLARWAAAWLLKTRQIFSLVFTWHRASGLWVWGMLLVFSWSAVALNFGAQVYKPVMNVFWAAPPPRAPLPELAAPRTHPKLDERAAREQGRRLMAEQARQRGFVVIRENWMDYDATHGVYNYGVESTLDIDARLPETYVKLDGDDGRLLAFRTSTGGTARGTIDRWLLALHFGAVREGGFVYRAFVCLLGLVVVLLSVTGVWIWWRKWRKRVARRREAY